MSASNVILKLVGKWWTPDCPIQNWRDRGKPRSHMAEVWCFIGLWIVHSPPSVQRDIAFSCSSWRPQNSCCHLYKAVANFLVTQCEQVSWDWRFRSVRNQEFNLNRDQNIPCSLTAHGSVLIVWGRFNGQLKYADTAGTEVWRHMSVTERQDRQIYPWGECFRHAGWVAQPAWKF